MAGAIEGRSDVADAPSDRHTADDAVGEVDSGADGGARVDGVPAGPAREAWRPRYRADVQGLRGIAVLLVVLCHAGVYLWGGVGRGKSFVMDQFFAAAPTQAKRRVHFHAFLQELQGRMLAITGQSDPLVRVARAIAELSAKADQLLLAEAKFHSARLRGEFEAAGAPQKEAAMVAHLFDMDGAVGLARLAVDSGIPTLEIADAFTDLGARLGLDWAQGTAAMANPSDPWERLLVAGLARDFQQMRLDLLRGLSAGRGRKAHPRA